MAKAHWTAEGWRCEKNGEHLHRAQWMDYRSPSIQLLTMVTSERLPILGELKGEHIVLTELGRKVAEEIECIPTYKGASSIEIYDYVVMPDHIHILLRIHDRLPKHLGQYVRWFKLKCSDACRALAAVPASKDSCLFAKEYHDRILTGKNQLKHMARYIMDNPRRLALKRANRNLFRIRQNVTIGDIPCTILGNIFLAEYPQRQPLQCSRKLTSEQITAYKEVCLAEAANGTVFITAAISEGEKVIARALREEGYPIIILLEKGFPNPDSPHYRYFKPQGVYFEACAVGKLLLLEPQADILERGDIVERVVARIGNIPHETQRYRFVAMNVIAEHMCYDSAEQRRGQDG